MLNIFEQKNNTVAFILMAIAAIFWGLFGLVSAVASDITTSPLFFTTIGAFFAALSSLLACFLLKVDIKSLLNIIKVDKKIRKFIIIRTLSGFNYLALVVGFFFLSNKIIGLLVFESAPMLAVLFSYYFLKDELSNHHTIAYSWLLIILSFIGVLILSLEVNTYSQDMFQLENNTDLLGFLLIFIGLIGNSLTIVTGPKITLLLQKKDPTISKLKHGLGGQLITNVLLFVLMGLISLFFYTPVEMSGFLNFYFLLLAMFFGVFVSFLPTAISRLAGSLATSHNIFIAWFLTPIVGILLLWNFGYGEINSTIVLSFILILVPNLLLNLDIEKSFSFKATFIWILLFTIVLFYSQGKPIESETYFNSANALLVFFALMIGYLISKLNERSNFRERLFMQFLHKIRGDGVDEWAVESISAKFQQANNRLTDKVKDELLKFNINTGKYSELLDFKFIQNRRLYNVGELFVLLLISLLLIGITTVYRDNSFLYDSYAFIVNTAVVFTLAQVVERMFFSEYEQQTPKNILMKNTVSMLFLIVLIIAIVILFSSKHNFNI